MTKNVKTTLGNDNKAVLKKTLTGQPGQTCIYFITVRISKGRSELANFYTFEFWLFYQVLGNKIKQLINSFLNFDVIAFISFPRSWSQVGASIYRNWLLWNQRRLVLNGIALHSSLWRCIAISAGFCIRLRSSTDTTHPPASVLPSWCHWQNRSVDSLSEGLRLVATPGKERNAKLECYNFMTADSVTFLWRRNKNTIKGFTNAPYITS